MNTGDPAVQHSLRFRKVANLYPRWVAAAYDGDIAAAAAASDEEVADRVNAWIVAQGEAPHDFAAEAAERAAMYEADGIDASGRRTRPR